VALAGSIYGLGYWSQREHPENGTRLRLFYGMTAAGMLLLVSAHNTVLFLAGWEIMALSALMALTAEDTHAEVRLAGYVYMVATRAGTLALFATFATMFLATGNFDFSLATAAVSPGAATAIFVLALLGFGLKAGLMPLHLWLPGAHANAPTHVSALMSGVLIKMGIYGLVRVSAMLPNPTVAQGAWLLILGVISGVLGVVFAIGQHDIKRLLAYHSVENIGIICLGLGVAHLGRALGEPGLVALGIAGAVLHTFNHGMFKALLFLAAGVVAHTTHTRSLDRLGGLLKPLPLTGALFLVGAIAICGLPPLNGFVSELLVYLGLFGVVDVDRKLLWLLGAFGAAGLALIGGLALACFVKVFGAVFLGEPRSEGCAKAHEPSVWMRLPMVVLAAICFGIGLGSPLLVPVLDHVVQAYAPIAAPSLVVRVPFTSFALLGVVLLGMFAAVFAWMNRNARSTQAPTGVGTWACGYARPTARMQYSASSFGEMLVGLGRWALRLEESPTVVRGTFARPVAFHSHVPEVVLDLVVVPFAERLVRLFRLANRLQGGDLNAYLFYVFATLVVVFLWVS